MDQCQSETLDGAAVTSQRLKACLKLTVLLTQENLPAFFKAWHDKLEELSDKAPNDKLRLQFAEVQRAVKKHSDALQKRMLQHVGENFALFRKKELNTTSGEEKFGSDMLSLVDNEDLEEAIAISSVSRRAESYYGEILWALNKRFAMLNDGELVDESSNPVAPVQFCEALRKTLKIMDIGIKPKILGYRIFAQVFTPHFKELYEEVNNYLLEQGILPNLSVRAIKHRDEARNSGKGTETAPAPKDLVGAIRQLQQGVQPQSGAAPGQQPSSGGAAPGSAAPQGFTGVTQPGGIMPLDSVANQLGGGPIQNAGGQLMQPVQVFSQGELLDALQGLQVTGLEAPALSGSIPAAGFGSLDPQQVSLVNTQFIQQLKEQLGDASDKGMSTDHMHTIDLVGMLFEYVLNDENLPDSTKALLSYLHTPYMKIAFLDTNFFEKADHPARVLLNTMAEAGSRWVATDGSSQFGVFEKIQETVRSILERFENDVRIFAELLLDFSAYSKKISRRVELMEKRATEKVQGEEKLREVKTRVNREIRRRTGDKDVPSAVLLLLLQPWSDYLAFILLRYGEQSEAWQKALALADELLWSVAEKETHSDKVRLMAVQQDIVAALKRGLESISYDADKSHKLFSALDDIYKRLLHNKRAEPAPVAIRKQLEEQAAEKAGVSESGDESPQNDDEQRLVDNLKMMEFGTWFEFSGGKRLKVAWFNAKTQNYMLVDPTGKKAGMKTGISLARAMLGGDAKIIAGSTKPFFERALENIFEKLKSREVAALPPQ